ANIGESVQKTSKKLGHFFDCASGVLRQLVEEHPKRSRTAVEHESKSSRSLPEAVSKRSRTTVEQQSNKCRTTVEQVSKNSRTAVEAEFPPKFIYIPDFKQYVLYSGYPVR